MICSHGIARCKAPAFIALPFVSLRKLRSDGRFVIFCSACDPSRKGISIGLLQNDLHRVLFSYHFQKWTHRDQILV